MTTFHEIGTPGTECSSTSLPRHGSNMLHDMDTFFQNNLAHIDYLVMEAKAWVALAFIRMKNLNLFDPASPDLSFLNLPEDVTGISDARQWCRGLEIRRKEMEEGSRRQNVSLNFLTLCSQYALDSFETRIVQFLLAADTSLEFSGLIDECGIESWSGGKDDIDVGTVLSILTDGYREQIEKRRYFSINAPLVEHLIVKLHGWSSTRIVDTEIELHSRISNFILGDNNIYEAGMLCFTSEKPCIDLDSVIIDPAIKQDLVKYAEAFLSEGTHRAAIADSFQYGTAFTCLFHGPSGTGKTMLANALASRLGCSIFNLNLGDLDSLDVSFSRALQTVFREARLSGGIVFLDECDDVLQDNSAMSRTFLIEIEKAQCITILATNRTVKLDPAMDRRISLKIPFRLPETADRRRIWEALLPAGATYAPDVDLDELASRYQFSGGLIKNALVMAAARASLSNRAHDGTVILESEEVHNAAEYQTKSMFDTAGYVRIPDADISTLPVHRQERERLARIAEVIPEYHRSGNGFSMLISAEDLETGRWCVEAIMCRAGFMMHEFSDEELFQDEGRRERKSVLDPVTQQQLSLIDYLFAIREGMQQASVILDRTGMFNRFFQKKDDKSQDIVIKGFMDRVSAFKGILFLVTSSLTERSAPLEFSYSMSLGYPSEEQQIRCWEQRFPALREEELLSLVERFPMHMKEIDMIADRLITAARIEGTDMAAVSKFHIEQFVMRLKTRKTVPVLFGT